MIPADNTLVQAALSKGDLDEVCRLIEEGHEYKGAVRRIYSDSSYSRTITPGIATLNNGRTYEGYLTTHHYTPPELLDKRTLLEEALFERHDKLLAILIKKEEKLPGSFDSWFNNPQSAFPLAVAALCEKRNIYKNVINDLLYRFSYKDIKESIRVILDNSTTSNLILPDSFPLALVKWGDAELITQCKNKGFLTTFSLSQLMENKDLDRLYAEYGFTGLCTLASIKPESIEAFKLYTQAEVRRIIRIEPNPCPKTRLKIVTLLEGIRQPNHETASKTILNGLQMHRGMWKPWKPDSAKHLPIECSPIHTPFHPSSSPFYTLK